MLTLNVGFTKKVGEAHYGSRGASVNLELELDSALVGDPDRLKERMRQLFGLAKASVDEELAQRLQTVPPRPRTPMPKATDGGETARAGRPPAKSRALNAIADRKQIPLPELLTERFQIHDPAGLTITEASSLIDELKGPGGTVAR